MQLPEAQTLVERLIKTGDTHQDYQRTVDLAETYRIYITGKDIDKKLEKYVPREDPEMFLQRVRLTKSITPAVASSIRQPYNKVTRNDRIRKDIVLGSPDRKNIVLKMMKSFFGSPRKKNKGLEYWMKTRLVDLNFIDPNTWVVVEWASPQSESEVIRPRPWEVTAEQAVNFYVVNDEVKWLLVKQQITFKATSGSSNNPSGKPGAIMPAQDKTSSKQGYRWTLYDEDVTVVYEQVDKEAYELGEGEEWGKVEETNFVVRTYEPKVGYPPVFRVGYKRDEETKGRTFVNPWHDALCYFDKTLKTVSELDLTMTLHTFPQKIQYVQQCQGTKSKKCNRGLTADGQTCGECKGSGYKLHTTAQDAILLPMPADPKDMMDLDKILVYKTPPIELIKFQNEYTQQLERQAHQAVYNSQVFIKKAGSPGATGQPIQTATEADFNMQSVYDALEPFTEKFSELWRDFVTTFAIIAGEDMDNVNVSHDFPADYKLKTSDVLMTERKTAAESGAPGFIIESIDDDLANITFAGDDVAILKYRVRRRYFPFPGCTSEEIVERLTSEYVPKEPKILYSNFESIFIELGKETPDFYVMKDLDAQAELVKAKVVEYGNKLDEQKPKVTIDTFRNNNPAGGGGGNNGGQNGGQEDKEEEQTEE